MRKSKWYVFKKMMLIGMFMTIFLIAIQIGSLYTLYKADYPSGDWYSFIRHKPSHRINLSPNLSFGELPNVSTGSSVDAERFVDIVRRYNLITRNVWIALFFYVMYELFDFKGDKNHWIRKIKPKKLNLEWEDEKDA